MTNDEKNRWIAKKLGYSDAATCNWKWSTPPIMGCGEHICIEARQHNHTSGVMDWARNHLCKCGASLDSKDFENGISRDFCNDPAMQMILLERLLIHHDVKFQTGGEPNYNLSYFDGAKWTAVDGTTLGQAIVDAFMLAWKES